MFKVSDELAQRSRRPNKKHPLRRLKEYALQRCEMLDYRTVRVRGWDIGSGPTEALQKMRTLRLKRPSLKWDADHAPAMMTLLAMRENNQHQQ